MINTKRYQQQLTDLICSPIETKPEYRKMQHKIMVFHDNDPSNTAKLLATR